MASHLWFRSMSNRTIWYAFIRRRYLRSGIMLRSSDEKRYYIVPTHSWEAIIRERVRKIQLCYLMMRWWRSSSQHLPVSSYQLCTLDSMESAEYSAIDTSTASSRGGRTVLPPDLCLLSRDICYKWKLTHFQLTDKMLSQRPHLKALSPWAIKFWSTIPITVAFHE